MTPMLYNIIFLVLSLLMITSCGEDPQPVQQAKPQASPSQPSAPAPEPQAPATPPVIRSSTWPFLSEEIVEGALAKNVMAKNYFLIFDGSGSMRESKCSGSSRKIDVAKKAVVTWSKSIPADANLGMYAFHNPGLLTLPLATGNRDIFMQTVNQIRAGGNTPLDKAMEYAYDRFTEQGRRQLGYGEYTIVVVTDGIASSIFQLQLAVDKILSNTPITIYSIGFCIGEHHSLNQPGRTIYKSADNPEQLGKGLREVLAESETFDELDFSK